jgi:hypothetical protein
MNEATSSRAVHMRIEDHGLDFRQSRYRAPLQRLHAVLQAFARSLSRQASRKAMLSRAHRQGSSIYSKRHNDCRAWSCRWKATRRPAACRAPTARTIRSTVSTTTSPRTIPRQTNAKVGAYQVWVDPAFPDAHRAPELRAWVEKQNAKHGCVFVIRYSARAGFTLIPPTLSDGHGWLESTASTREARAPVARTDRGWMDMTSNDNHSRHGRFVRPFPTGCPQPQRRQNALERLQERDWIRLIDVTPIELR